MDFAEMKAARSPLCEAAGRVVELRPAPKARSPAHPQERQHSAAVGGTRDAGPSAPGPKLSPCGVSAAPRQGSSPEWAETLVILITIGVVGRAAPGAARLEPGPKGTRQEMSTYGRENFPRLNPRLNGDFSLG
jgi:hypothetical protein